MQFKPSPKPKPKKSKPKKNPPLIKCLFTASKEKKGEKKFPVVV
jgi:hypothetical protein